jgi:hypothetical protein
MAISKKVDGYRTYQEIANSWNLTSQSKPSVLFDNADSPAAESHPQAMQIFLKFPVPNHMPSLRQGAGVA